MKIEKTECLSFDEAETLFEHLLTGKPTQEVPRLKISASEMTNAIMDRVTIETLHEEFFVPAYEKAREQHYQRIHLLMGTLESAYGMALAITGGDRKATSRLFQLASKVAGKTIDEHLGTVNIQEQIDEEMKAAKK
jgi:hypothetical protein